MSIMSFKEEVIIRDSNKAREIAIALKQPRDKSIKPAKPEKLPVNAGAVWFKHSEK